MDSNGIVAASWLTLVFPTRVFLNLKLVFFGYFLLPETLFFFLTAKPRYFKNPGIAVSFKY